MAKYFQESPKRQTILECLRAGYSLKEIEEENPDISKKYIATVATQEGYTKKCQYKGKTVLQLLNQGVSHTTIKQLFDVSESYLRALKAKNKVQKITLSDLDL